MNSRLPMIHKNYRVLYSEDTGVIFPYLFPEVVLTPPVYNQSDPHIRRFCHLTGERSFRALPEKSP